MDYVVIDVREPWEFADGHIKGAINLSLANLMSGAPELNDIPKDANIIVYCRTGNRSSIAMNILRGMGFKNIVNGINQEQVEARYDLKG